MHHAEIDLDQVRARLTEATRQADPTGVGAEVRHATVEVDPETPIDEADFTRGVVFMLNKFGDESGGEGALQTLTSMNNIVEMAVSEVESFRQIVRDDAFFLAFQPIVSIKTGSVHHFEALCRFQDLPPGVSPFQQIQFAEETGMIAELDLAVVHKVIGLLAQRPRSAAPIKVAVNVSGVSVGSDAYVTGLWKLLDYNRWTRGQLLFEITESARMSDLACANTFIQGLRERGYKVCLDDLGAGAASFRYLSALDVDMVKLDGSAVRNARKAAKGRAFLSALAELCRRLGTETVAEMIEDEQGLSFARQCGVDFVQGYLFGRPSPNLKDFEPLPNATIFQRVRRDAATASR
jgi:EAL domain-containing protein (putative c-di-GMP-specific phosphodiesterase class I)